MATDDRYKVYIDPPSFRPGDAGGPPQYRPGLQTGDPYDMIQEDRRSWYDRGNRIDQDLRDELTQRQQMESGYRGLMNQAYGNLAETPGYTTDEANSIVRQREYEGLVTPDSAYQNLNPTDAEWYGMMGDPNRYRGWFDPQQMEAIDNDAAQQQRQAVERTGQRLDEGYAREQEGYNQAIDPNRLRQSGGFNQSIDSAMLAGESGVRGAIDPNRLRMDAGFADRYRMSDADVQGYQNLAASNVASKYGAMMGDVQRDAAASGNAGPMAVAAARARLAREAGSTSADAQLQARLAAKQEQAGREYDIEGMRQNAERGYSGLASAAESDLYGRRLDTEFGREQQRIGAEQGLTDRQMQAASNMGQRRMQGETYRGGLQTDVERGIGNQKAGTQQYITNMGTGIEQSIDQTQAQRNADLYGARRDNAAYAIDNKFNQGLGVQDRLSSGNQSVANARIGGQQEQRGWLTGQTSEQMQAQQQARNQRNSNFGTQGSLVNETSANMGQYDIARRGQSFGTNFKTNLGASLGKGIGQGITNGIFKKSGGN
jgi:hypothetical protein